jgi:transposase InsO family protein
VLAFALGHPGFGPRRISAELARPKWGGIRISEHGVWRVLKRFNLNTRCKRHALIARHADPYERRPETTPKALHIDATQPGEKVQMDCFYVGRLAGSKGVVWQYTAIDVASAYAWALLRSEDHNPSARRTAELCHLVAAELKAAGCKLNEVSTDNGSEFRSKLFGDAVDSEGATQRRIKAGRPNSNGCAERLQLTILEECWRPAFSRSLAPKITALQRDLDDYLRYYNTDRAHTGRLTKGRVPADIVFGARKTRTVR